MGYTFVYFKVVIVAQSCQSLCDPMDCSLPGSSVYGILQARILEWVAISFSRVFQGSSGQTQENIGRKMQRMTNAGMLNAPLLPLSQL